MKCTSDIEVSGISFDVLPKTIVAFLGIEYAYS
jgi:hypothetical protein